MQNPLEKFPKNLLLTLVVVLSSLAFSPALFAANELNLEATTRDAIVPFFRTHIRRATFKAFDGRTISYAVFKSDHSRATIVISPGRTESIEMYAETIYDFASAGFDVAAIDHRGQGRSERLVASDAGHVGKFEDYVKDFAQFTELKAVKDLTGDQFLVSHSMGSTIAGLFTLANPTRFKKLVMVAPMIEIKAAPVNEMILANVVGWAETFGYQNSYAPTRSAFDLSYRFNQNGFTHSPYRYAFNHALLRTHHQLIVGGPTNNWVSESIRATRSLRNLSGEITLPTLVFSAGADFIVESNAQTTFCAVAKNCKLVKIPGANHCLFLESDAYRAPMMTKLLGFLR